MNFAWLCWSLVVLVAWIFEWFDDFGGFWMDLCRLSCCGRNSGKLLRANLPCLGLDFGISGFGILIMLSVCSD